ncbi:hypothetical protein DFH29DRAFT_1005082 [Suillus ampliporus]|nr:hypothetical protein DFH29DRAFT_1005082 [Suillus ampliporus]
MWRKKEQMKKNEKNLQSEDSQDITPHMHQHGLETQYHQAELDTLTKEIPTDFLKDDAATFTQLMDPHNPRRTIWITEHVQYGDDLTPEELNKEKLYLFREQSTG